MYMFAVHVSRYSTCGRDIQIHRINFTCSRLATPTASQIGRYLYPLARASFDAVMEFAVSKYTDEVIIVLCCKHNRIILW